MSSVFYVFIFSGSSRKFRTMFLSVREKKSLFTSKCLQYFTIVSKQSRYDIT